LTAPSVAASAAMEGAVVSSRVLLGKLSTVLAEKYVLLRGVGMEIVELDDLESMNACLCDLAAGGDYRHSEQASCVSFDYKAHFFFDKRGFP
jgi:hypothetical protein